MTKFLLDANLSPETRQYLSSSFELDVIDLITERKSHLTDDQIVVLAQEENRVVITLDLDFGEIYHLREKGRFGVLILRVNDQTIESVNSVLDRFFSADASTIDLEHSLVVLEEDRIRIVRGE